MSEPENVNVLTMAELDELDDMLAKVRHPVTLPAEMVGVFIQDGDPVTETSAGDA